MADVREAEGEFEAADGIRLYERSWLPPGAPRAAAMKAAVIIVHGYAEHAGRYAWTGEQLAARGYAAYAYDQRGHGRSPGRRALVRSFAEFTRDLAAYTSLVRSRHPGVPLFVLGHSMGGTVVTLSTILDRPDVRGVLLSGAVLPGEGRGGIRAAIVERLTMIVGRLLPRLPLAKLDAANVSRDPAVVDAYERDPLVYRGKIQAGLAAAMIGAIRQIRKGRGSIDAPLLLMHGTADALASPAGSEALYMAAISTDKTLRLFEGFAHEILNEPERDQVVSVIAAWIEARL